MSSLVDLDPVGLGAEASKPVEYTLVQIRECFVYRVTATHSARGYRADDWDLANPFATAELIVNQSGSDCFVRFYKKQQGGAMRQLLAECPLEYNKDTKHKAHHLKFFVEPVLDSSRYFVIRIKDRKTGRLASLGCGFRNREDAFSFQAACQDFFKQAKASSEESSGEKLLAPVQTAAKALDSGKKIKLNIKVKKKETQQKQQTFSMGGDFLSGMTSMKVSGGGSSTTSQQQETVVDDDDWGDFQ